ncbi:hypothetical protein R1sor_006274 [Riccia sorocarpa]|uniref:Uncharacterized protein n=1 Tax=Riccia sorocarpa TaxID=122646 RepID=A0ABD3HMK7_9MARC
MELFSIKQEARLKAAEQRAATSSQTKEVPKAKTASKKVTKKNIDASITIGIAGADVYGEVFDRLASYMDQYAMMGIMAFERGDAHLLLHIQGMISTQTTSTRKLKQDIKAAIGWDVEAPMEEDRRMHSIHGASEFKNRVQLTPTNVLAMALQFRKYRVKNPVSVTFGSCIKQMVSTWQYMSAIRWPTMSEISLYRAEKLWQSCVCPDGITMSDVDHIFFGQAPSEQYMNSSHGTKLMIADWRERITDIPTVREDSPKSEPQRLITPPRTLKTEDKAEAAMKPTHVKLRTDNEPNSK